ncbi:MAG: phage protein GemA/Gp16 family protein [Hydrogenoanaerobacterium sp.]
MGAVKAIEMWQLKKIWAIARAVGIDKEDLHAMANAESLKELTSADASEVLTRLLKLQGEYIPSTKKATAKKHTEVAGMATDGQQRKVWALMYELVKHDTSKSGAALGDRLCGIIKRELHTDTTAKEPFKWLTYKQCGQLIEAIKKYVVSAEKKQIKGGAG